MTKVNPVLKSIMRTIYQNRQALGIDPKTVVRHEISDQQPMCEVWFMTEGCSYAREGGCTMCNYGKGHLIDESTILTQLKNAFRELPEANYNLIVNPSGSFLDKHEVSVSLREGIYELLDDISFDSLTVESRADVLDLASMLELRNRYPNGRISIEIGVETFHPWLLRNSVNKGVTIEQIVEAVKGVHKSGLTAVANIGIGLPFINERKNVSVAVNSIKMAFDVGFDTVILFPYHVKPGTLLENLYQNSGYRCVSLWSLIAVLSQIPENQLKMVNISWYRNYYTEKSKIISSPATCNNCNDRVLAFLDLFKARPSTATLQNLSNYECECRTEWKKSIKVQDDTINFDLVAFQYRQLANQFGIPSELLVCTLKEMEDTLYANN